MSRMRDKHSTIVFNDSIFVLGGTALSYAESYDIERDEWLRLSEMCEKRSTSAGVCFENLIYAIGGWNGSKNLSTVEQFDPRIGAWQHVAPMSTRRCGAGAAVLDGKMYVSGGHNGSYLSTVETYDQRANKWLDVPSMNNARAWHGLVLKGDRLLAIGGDGNDRVPLDSVEIFYGGDQWTMSDPMRFGQCQLSGKVEAVVL